MSSIRQRPTAREGEVEIVQQPSTIESESESISSSKTSSDKLIVNLRKQAKFILIGYAGVWYLQVPLHFTEVLNMGGWSATIAAIALFLLASTIGLFGWVMLLPRGTGPDYARWQQDSSLKTLIPALTIAIVAGFISLLFTLSPLCAPPPPSQSLTTRLSEAANLAGSNLSSAYGGVQLVASEAAKALGFQPSSSSSSPYSPSPSSTTTSNLASLNTEKFLKVLRLQDVESLANRLGVSKERSIEFSKALDLTQARAEEWGRNNVKVMGWTGALFGSSTTYILVFGSIGLLGLFNRR